MGQSQRRRVSQADVAKAAGVSTSIVSTVVNGRTDGPIRVAEATRQRVLTAVANLGYIPDPAARRLAGARSRVLGVFTYEAVFPLASPHFYHEFLIGIEQAAEEADHDLLLVTSSRRAADRRSVYATGVNGLRLADGGLLFGSTILSEDLARLSEEGYPFVFVGERHLDSAELSFVAADYVGATAELVHRAHRLGHRSIGFLEAHDEPIAGRIVGYDRAAAELALPHLRRSDLAPAAVIEWIRANGITALVLHNSEQLEALAPALVAAGIRVPDDLSLIGLTGEPEEVHGVAVSGLRIPRLEMGREGVRLLVQLIDDPSSGPLRTRLACAIDAGASMVAPSP